MIGVSTCSQRSTKDGHHEQDHSSVPGVVDPYVDGACQYLGAWQCSRCHRSANNLLAAAGRFTSVRSPRLVSDEPSSPVPTSRIRRLNRHGNAARRHTRPTKAKGAIAGIGALKVVRDLSAICLPALFAKGRTQPRALIWRNSLARKKVNRGAAHPACGVATAL